MKRKACVENQGILLFFSFEFFLLFLDFLVPKFVGLWFLCFAGS